MIGADAFDELRTVAQPGMGPARGQLPEVVAGRYQLREIVGQGGMGLVYRAFDLDLEETVAFKVLRAELADSDALRTRFRREVKLARRVTHANVARVFEFGRDCGTCFLTMEFIAGESLQALLLREAPLDPTRALELVVGLCEGLAAAHAAGVVHGDIKPGNVLIDRRRGAVLTDFGIAQALSDAAENAVTSGTPLYMAPEQARGGSVGPQADVYAVGVVLFAALTGQAPWPNADVTELIVRKRLGKEPDLLRLAPNMPAGHRALIADCLRNDPARRPADASTLLARLAELRGAPRPIAPNHASTPAPLATGEGLRWIAVDTLRAPAELAWIGADVVDALARTRAVRVLVGTRGDIGLQLAARIDGEARAHGDDIAVTVRVRDGRGESVLTSFVVRQPRSAWHDLGSELAARIAGAIGGGLVPAPRGTTLDADVSELFVRARHAYHCFRFIEAGRLFDAALERAPGNAMILAGRTLARVQATIMQDVDGSELAALRISAEELVAKCGDLGETHLVRARIGLALGDNAGSARALCDAIARAPSLVEAHALLADLQLETGRIPDAERRLDIALALDRRSVQTWNTRARQWAYQGRWDEIYALAEGTMAELGFRSPMLLRLMMWHPEKAAIERYAAVQLDNRDGLPAPMCDVARLMASFVLRQGDPRALIEGLRIGVFGRSHARRNCYFAQLICEMLCALGDLPAAFEVLEDSLDRHGMSDWQWVHACPAIEPLRGTSRLRRIQEITRTRADAVSEAIWG